MDLINYIMCLILAIFSAATVLIVRAFMVTKNYSFFSLVIFIIELIIVWVTVIIGYIYFIHNKIPMATFYPIIKIIELIIPVLVSVLYYKAQLIPINYVGIILAILAIICIGWH
jgi:multidrug transporter EmrE-like cation transporter